MTTFEQRSLAVAQLSLLISTIVAILLIVQLWFLRRQIADARRALDDSTQQAAEETTRRRRAETLRHFTLTVEDQYELQAKVPIMQENAPEHLAFRQRASVVGSEEFDHLRKLFSYYEHLAAGVNLGIFSFTVIDRTAGARLQRIWRMYTPWVMDERERIKRKRLYEEFETLANKLSDVSPLPPPVDPA